MKKFRIVLLLFICVLFVSCSEKQEDAEIIITDENQVETNYIIKKTDNPEEVKELFQMLEQAKINTNFNGVSLDLNADVSGKVIVKGAEVRTIDLGYTLSAVGKSNFKKCRLEGNLNLNGYTKTNSDSLSFTTDYSLTANVKNDDEYLFLDGSYKMGSSSFQVKNKIDMTYLLEKYKGMVVSSIDMLKYYNPYSYLTDTDELINYYQVSIVETTKDSFTLRLAIPMDEIFKINLDEKLYVEIKISCSNLLPKEIKFSADQLIYKILESDYIEKYLSEDVSIEKAKLSFSLKLDYGSYSISELTEEQKSNYKDFEFEDLY